MILTQFDKLQASETIAEHIKQYYLLKIGALEISEREGVNNEVFYRYLRSIGLKPRKKLYLDIDTGIKDLNTYMKQIYFNIVQRCKGRPNNKYDHIYNHEYMSAVEWVKVCNDNKNILLKLWQKFIDSDKKHLNSISVDRIDNSKGYEINNVQFVTTSFNSWKRNIRPLKIISTGEEKYFMSATEAEKYYGLNRQRFGEILRGKDRYNKEYFVEDASIEAVLNYAGVSSIEEYHNGLVTPCTVTV